MGSGVRKNRLFSVMVWIILVLIVGLVMTALMPASKQAESVRIPILMYHSLLKDEARWNDYVISPDEFERDLIYLTKNGYHTVFISDLINYVKKGAPLPENPVVITFDDGNYNGYSYAFELLKKYDCKMVMSPIASLVQEYSDKEDISPSYGYCNWTQLREMQESGLVEIQNHSWDMHKASGRIGISQLSGESNSEYMKTVGADIEKAQEQIEINLGTRPRCFTYPFGAYNEQSELLIKNLGFESSLSCMQTTSEITKNDPESLYNLGRFLRDNKHSAQMLLE